MHGCTHAAQTTTIPGAPGSREAGEPWKALRYTFQSQPLPSSGTMLFQNFRSCRSTAIRAVMAGGNTTSPCVQWQLHKLRGQHQLSQGDPKPRKASKSL